MDSDVLKKFIIVFTIVYLIISTIIIAPTISRMFKESHKTTKVDVDKMMELQLANQETIDKYFTKNPENTEIKEELSQESAKESSTENALETSTDVSLESKICYKFNNKYNTNFEESDLTIMQLTNVNGDSVLECVLNDQINELDYKVYFYQSGDYITDDYPKLLYKDKFDENFKLLSDKCFEDNDLEFIDYNIYYSMNKNKYSDLEQFEDYIVNTDAHYVINIKVDNIDNYEEKVLRMINNLDSLNYQYAIKLIKEDKIITIHRSKDFLNEYKIEDLKFDNK